MKISKLIQELQNAQNKHGDMPVFTYDGDIQSVKITPCKDGISSSFNGIVPEFNELVIEIISA